MAAVSDVEAVCDPSTINTGQLDYIKQDPKRLELAREMCAKSPTARKKLDEAMAAATAEAAAEAAPGYTFLGLPGKNWVTTTQKRIDELNFIRNHLLSLIAEQPPIETEKPVTKANNSKEESPKTTSFAPPTLGGLDVHNGIYRGEIGEAQNHNGSTMWLFRKAGLIVYNNPKPSIAGAVRSGDVVFSGHFEGKNASGRAFVFKAGCEPASYAVQGRSVHKILTLAGASPVRARVGCAVEKLSEQSPNAHLTFIGNAEFAD
jgi:hypothetical protein